MPADFNALIAKANEGLAAVAAINDHRNAVVQASQELTAAQQEFDAVMNQVGQPLENIGGPLRVFLDAENAKLTAAKNAYNDAFQQDVKLQANEQMIERQCLAILQPWLAVSLTQS